MRQHDFSSNRQTRGFPDAEEYENVLYMKTARETAHSAGSHRAMLNTCVYTLAELRIRLTNLFHQAYRRSTWGPESSKNPTNVSGELPKNFAEIGHLVWPFLDYDLHKVIHASYRSALRELTNRVLCNAHLLFFHAPVELQL